MKKTLLLSATLATFAHLFATAPEVTVTSTSQNAARLVTVEYTLAGEPGIITCVVETNRGDGVWTDASELKCVTHLAGDVNKLVDVGSHSFTWRPDKAWPGHCITNQSLRIGVRAWATNAPPPYLVVNLTSGAKAYYPSAEAIPYGVSNNLYKTEQLVLRLIPAGHVSARLGALLTDNPRDQSEYPHVVEFSEDFYIGIYEMTQGQVKKFSNMTTSFDNSYEDSPLRPMQNVSTDSLRGKAGTVGDNWPNSDKAVAHGVVSTTILGALRWATGIDFDLPTAAQWEFAARAGEGARLPNGGTDSDAGLNPIAWTNRQAGNHTHPVGLLQPNAWGLYDVIGNVDEMCLDWYDANYLKTLQDAGTTLDPPGPEATSGNKQHVIKGGNWSDTHPRCAYHIGWDRDKESSGGGKHGFRVVAPVSLKW